MIERRVWLWIALGCALGPMASRAADPAPLAAAHSHNDYLRARPLEDALELGFSSVEADIFLVDGRLLVAHDFIQVRAERTLEGMYLEPLAKRVRDQGGRVHRGSKEPFFLLIDLKNRGAETWPVVEAALARHPEVFSSFEKGAWTERAVTVVISGDRPRALIAGATSRRSGIDGRMGDLDSELPAHLLPWISDNWGNHFRWRGAGPIPAAEREKLHDMIARAHARGRRVRFWATPENEALWAELRTAGADLLNADDLPRLAAWLRGPGAAIEAPGPAVGR